MPYSNCCGAHTNMEELGICPRCKEHCEFEPEEPADRAELEAEIESWKGKYYDASRKISKLEDELEYVRKSLFAASKRNLELSSKLSETKDQILIDELRKSEIA